MAAAVIDALLITLGIKDDDFQAGRKRAEEDLRRTKEEAADSAKKIDASGEVAARFFRRMRNEALALFAVFTAGRGLKDFIRDITLTDAATGHMAEDIGISTRELAAWEGAAERAGGSAGGMAQSMLGLNQSLQQLMLTGSSQAVGVLRGIGIDALDANNKLKPMNQLMLELADHFSKLSMPQSLAEGRMLGFDAGTVQLLHQGTAEVQKLLDAQNKMGVPGEGDAKRAQTLLNDLKDIQQTIIGIARGALNDVSPKLDELLKKLEQWLLDKAPKIKAAVREWTDWLLNMNWGAVGEKIATFAGGIDDVVRMLGGWQRATEVLFALWVGAKFLAVLSSIAQISKALGMGMLGRLIGSLALLAPLLLLTGPGGAAAPGGEPDWPSEEKQMSKDPKDQAEVKQFFERQSREHPSVVTRFMDWFHGRVRPQTTTVEQDARAKQGIDYFVKQGWTPEQAAGLVGNLQQESSFDPRAQYEGHVGIAQWSRHRAEVIQKHFGKSVLDMSYEEQLAALQWEISPQGPLAQAGHQLRLSTTAAESAKAADEFIEMPGNYDVENPKRIANANARLQAWRGGAASGAARAAANNNTHHTRNTSHQVHVNGPITVNTQATDARGIARGISGALRDAMMVNQVNSGLA